ncbi:MAG: AAA family ATPase [Deltaproteobacteria bacterium]|jgi:hypothetical protein|nr:AAA family ATPase [Deltaproteobacteria bacterium]
MTNLQNKDLVQSSIFTDFFDRQSPIVDKTGLIMDLLREPPGSYLICRPRRFGKTLLLDTIENIFKGKKHLFNNLEIGQCKNNYDWKILPVIRLDMSGTHSSVSQLRQDLKGKLSDIADQYGVSIDTTNETRAISTLIRKVSEKHVAFAKANDIPINEDHPRNIVLLIDEYDFCLQPNILDFGKTRKLKTLLRVFFSEIKSLQNRIRFALITGITKFDEISLSSGMNNVEDISYESRYSGICGFTISEIKTTFSDYLNPMLDDLKLKGKMVANATVEHLMQEFERWYDGYSWDGQTKVLNPRSVMKCLSRMKFFEYWQNTGPSLMFDQLGIGPENYFKVFIDNLAIEHNISISESHTIFNDNAIMLMSGYLTIDSVAECSDSVMYSLSIPNYEIKKVIKNSILTKRSAARTHNESLGLSNPKFKRFYDAFCRRDEEQCEMLFSSFIASSSYLYNLTGELFFTFLLSLLLDIGNNKPTLEAHTNKGRTDVVVPTPSGEWMVIEVKSENLHNPSDSVLSQVSRESDIQHYGTRQDPLADPVSVSGIHSDLSKLSTASAGSAISRVLVVGEVPEAVSLRLEILLSRAFDQMVDKVYTLPFLGRDKAVWAVGVAIADSKFVKIRFREAVWKDETHKGITLSPLHD